MGVGPTRLGGARTLGTPSLLARAHARPSSLPLSPFSYLPLFSPSSPTSVFTCPSLIFSLFSLRLSLFLVPHFSRTSVITYMEGGGTVYQTRPKRVSVVPHRELVRKTFYVLTYFVGKLIFCLMVKCYFIFLVKLMTTRMFTNYDVHVYRNALQTF